MTFGVGKVSFALLYSLVTIKQIATTINFIIFKEVISITACPSLLNTL